MERIIMKRLIILISILLSLSVLCGLSFFCHKNNNTKNIEVIYIDRSSVINTICEFDNTYYYTGEKGIYSNNNCVFSTEEDPLIYANDSTLFVYANGEITKYDRSLSPICKYKLPTEVTKFAVSDNEIFCIDSDDKYYVLDITTLKNKNTVKTEKINDNIIYHYTDFSICEDLTNYSMSSFFDNKSISSVKDHSKQFVYLSENCLIQTSKTNTNTINLYKTMLYDSVNNSTIDFPTGYGIVSLFPENNDLIFVGSEYPLDPHLDFEFSHDLKYHQSDCIVIIDIDSFKIINKWFTKKGEKIIYADGNKAVTYYNGEYLTYSLDKWEIIDSRSTDKIQSGGSYLFKACGNYVFVFDNNSNKLLEMIKVGS